MMVSGKIHAHEVRIMMGIRVSTVRMDNCMCVVFTVVVRMLGGRVNMQAKAAQQGKEVDANHPHPAIRRQEITMSVLHTLPRSICYFALRLSMFTVFTLHPRSRKLTKR